MNPISVTGFVDNQHWLSAQMPESIPPGPVTVLIVPSGAQDEADGEWMAGIAKEWEDELADSRQDIYTLADGEPVDAP